MKKIEIEDTSKVLFPEPKSSDISEVEAIFKAQKKICIWQRKIDKYQRKINKNKGKLNSKEIADFDLFKIEFPRDVTGHIYADYILNEADPITESQALGTTVLFKRLKCFLHFNRDAGEFPKIYISVWLENLQTSSLDFKKEINYKVEIPRLFINWISEKEDGKEGFANSSYNSPLIGQALIFNDDSIREDINSAIKNTLEKIKKKYGYAPKPIQWAEAQIKLAREETTAHYK